MNEVDDVREDEVIDKISMKHDKNGITQQNGTTHDYAIHDKNGNLQENGIPTKMVYKMASAWEIEWLIKYCE